MAHPIGLTCSLTEHWPEWKCRQFWGVHLIWFANVGRWIAASGVLCHLSSLPCKHAAARGNPDCSKKRWHSSHSVRPVTSDLWLEACRLTSKPDSSQTVAPLGPISCHVRSAPCATQTHYSHWSQGAALSSSHVITAEPHCCSSLTVPIVASQRRDKTPNVISYKPFLELFHWRWDQVCEWNVRMKQLNGRHRVKATGII